MIELRRQAKASGPYLTDLRCRIGPFTKAFPAHPASVTTADCQRHLDALNGASSTKNATRQVLWRLFAHCESRRYIPRASNPIAETQRFNGPHEKAIEVWTPAEMAKLRDCATPDFLPCLAVGGFAGLRTSEILALDWGDVRLAERTIKVSHRKARCHNSLRHSFCGYRAAAIKNDPQTALEAANSAATIFSHYRALASEAEGKAWFAIEPKRGPRTPCR